MKWFMAALGLCVLALQAHAKNDTYSTTLQKMEFLGNTTAALGRGPEYEVCRKRSVIFENEQREILSALEKGFVGRNPRLIRNSFSPEFTSASFARANGEIQRTEIDDRLVLVARKGFKPIRSSSELEADLSAYFKEYKDIKRVEFEAFELESNKTFSSADLSVFFMIKGTDASDHLRQDSGIMKLSLVKKEKSWTASSLGFQKFETLVNVGKPRYQRMTFETKTYQRLEAIRRGGYAIAVGDYNSDGNQDLLVGSYGPLEIYKGDGKGGLTLDLTTNIPADTLVKSAAWSDLDNDGDQDLVLARFVDNRPPASTTEESVPRLEDPDISVSVYRNLGSGKFELAGRIVDPTEINDRAMPIALGDFNRDGLIDVYVGFPGVKDFTAMTAVNDKTRHGVKVQGVYLNKGGLKFAATKMSTHAQELFENFGEKNLLFPHSAMAFDIDQNGTTDLAVVDDRGNLSPIYRNKGNSQFVESSKDLFVRNRGFGMGLAAADINNDGRLDFALSNITFSATDQFERCMKSSPAQRGLWVYLQQKEKGDVRFSPLGGADFDHPGQALGGIEFLDYDQDGLQDLYVTNGLWSGDSPDSRDVSGVIYRALRSGRFEDVLEDNLSGTRGHVMNLLANYKDKQGNYLSMAGRQSKRLYKNIGKNRFVDVAYVENLDNINDGYVIAKADLNNDGREDLVLRNADPGTMEAKLPPVEIYLAQDIGRSGLKLKLVGKHQNRDAIGAEVRVSAKGMPEQLQQVIANNGCAQSQKALFFGLGDQSKATRVQVKWPDGHTQEFHDLTKGTHELVEDARVVAKVE